MTLRNPRLLAGLIVLLLALAALAVLRARWIGPSLHEAQPGLMSYDVQDSPAPAVNAPDQVRLPAVDGEPPDASSRIAVAPPRIAYSYVYHLRLPEARVGALEEAHLALCRRLGERLCRVTSMQRGADGSAAPGGQLKLQVAASLAEPFGRASAALASDHGADLVDRAISAEDLSRQMVDSDARIRTRETLIQRLTLLLQTRSGNIEQAVEAERAINTAQKELEAARAELADMSGRVAMSAVEIDYAARDTDNAPGTVGPLQQGREVAWQSLFALVLLVVALLPWAVVAGLIFLLVRATRRRRAAPEE